ncbi:DJ-1 [Trametopsis cervina]|nr:DJ-1 [Trametopsis cervina]
MTKALILIADGTEEMEFTITYDTLVRAGVSCTSAYVPAETIDGAGYTSPPFAKGSRGINILPDTYFSPQAAAPEHYDLLVIPGGAKGAETISGSSPIQHLVREYIAQGKYVGMICAGLCARSTFTGSLAASTSGLPKQPLTSHPSVQAQLERDFEYSEEPVVVSGHLVTSRGPGTTFPFALTLVELLCGKDKRREVAGPMVFPANTFA